MEDGDCKNDMNKLQDMESVPCGWERLCDLVSFIIFPGKSEFNGVNAEQTISFNQS